MTDYPKEPSREAKLEALKHPDGWVYVIDDNYKNKDDVPPQAILGAWKVNKQGIITDNFILNPGYKKWKH